MLFNRLVFVLTLLGLLVSGFLLYEYNLTSPIFCPVGGGCETVRSSAYSQFLGISIPILGIIFYLSMAILSILRIQKLEERRLWLLQLVMALGGVGFGVYLTSLELFVIKAICFWCVLSFIISLVLLLPVFISQPKNEIRS